MSIELEIYSAFEIALANEIKTGQGVFELSRSNASLRISIVFLACACCCVGVNNLPGTSEIDRMPVTMTLDLHDYEIFDVAVLDVQADQQIMAL